MKMTILDMVQDILSDMDSDEVNSITDTTEAFQVASIIRQAYYEIIARKDWDFLTIPVPLLSAGQPSFLPTSLIIDENYSRIEYVAYNRKEKSTDPDKYERLTYLYPDEFYDYCNRRDSSESNVFKTPGLNVLLLNDQPPTYWTSLQEDSIITFDSWVSSWTTSVIGEEAQCYATVTPPWTMENLFVPVLPGEMFPALLAEAKSIAFNALVQSPNAKAEQQATRQYEMMVRKDLVSKGKIRYPNYGRVSNKSRSRRSSLFPERD